MVFDDADLEPALETIAAAGYYNAGQDCTAATRVLAAERVYDDVVTGLAGAGVGLGDGRHARERDDTRARQLRASARAGRGLVERAPDHAEVVTGGAPPERPGFYVEPTVVAGLSRGTS